MDYPFELSVLIPCYNVDRYLDLSLWCLEQQWDDEESMEIVFVNDGSTDGTLKKLQSYCRKHPNNTVLINKEKNGGVAQARNDALKVARGRWITFFDPDDALSAGAYQALYNDYLDDKVDILSFETNIVLGADVLPLPHYRGQVVWEGDSKAFYKKYQTDVTWDLIYSHQLLDRLGASFQGVSFLEGELFNLDVFLNEGIRVRRVSSDSYYYIARSSSLSSVGNSPDNFEKVQDLMTVIEYMELKKQQHQDDTRLVERIQMKQCRVARRLVPLFLRCDQVDSNRINQIRQQLKQWDINPYKTFTGGLKDASYNLMLHWPGVLMALRPALKRFLSR